MREINRVQKRLYTLKEAAQYLGRSEWGMRELVWKRLIPTVIAKAGRKIYIDVIDLDAFIEKNKTFYS
ncbi:MAG: helix-turn-helix domain-containing protein [Syntrophales bacterium]